MFCPKCATQTTDDVKFCRKCGANLRAVQEALTGRSSQPIDWDKTWVKEMLMSQGERERRQGKTPEVKRMEEIKGGVITAAVGLSAMAFLYFFLGVVAQGENAKDAAIISKVWLAGLVPFAVGLAILFNGLVISKRIVKLKQEQQDQLPNNPAHNLSATSTNPLPEADTTAIPNFSVTEPTTYRLPQPPSREQQ